MSPGPVPGSAQIGASSATDSQHTSRATSKDRWFEQGGKEVVRISTDPMDIVTVSINWNAVCRVLVVSVLPPTLPLLCMMEGGCGCSCDGPIWVITARILASFASAVFAAVLITCDQGKSQLGIWHLLSAIYEEMPSLWCLICVTYLAASVTDAGMCCFSRNVSAPPYFAYLLELGDESPYVGFVLREPYASPEAKGDRLTWHNTRPLRPTVWRCKYALAVLLATTHTAMGIVELTPHDNLISGTRMRMGMCGALSCALFANAVTIIAHALEAAALLYYRRKQGAEFTDMTRAIAFPTVTIDRQEQRGLKNEQPKFEREGLNVHTVAGLREWFDLRAWYHLYNYRNIRAFQVSASVLLVLCVSLVVTMAVGVIIPQEVVVPLPLFVCDLTIITLLLLAFVVQAVAINDEQGNHLRCLASIRYASSADVTDSDLAWRYLIQDTEHVVDVIDFPIAIVGVTIDRALVAKICMSAASGLAYAMIRIVAKHTSAPG